MDSKDYTLRSPGNAHPMLPEAEGTVWSFDLGKASIGEAVRLGNKFLHIASLLLPEDFAETKSATTRRRMWRTRQAHKARELWLDEVMRGAGIEPLAGRRTARDPNTGKWKLSSPGDPQLEREFAAPGDPTCYTSCLLRIRLLRGEPLQPWQVYKALHSAIQRRGYDPDIPWKTREQRRNASKEDDEGSTLARMQEYEKKLQEMAPGLVAFHLPCYFDAWKMRLWNPAQPDTLLTSQNCHAGSTRNHIVPRKLVEKEIRALVQAAARQYPQLQGKEEYVLYGPSETPYASYNADLRKKHHLREGGKNDWQGVLGQKIPRFDNRIIGKCVLIPRMNVCKIRRAEDGSLHPKSAIAAEVVFLMKLKNMRLHQGSAVRGLSSSEIAEIFKDPKRAKLGLTATQWKKWCLHFGAQPLPGQNQEVEEPSFSGRSRFCRPALEIIKRLILSGQTPASAQAAELLLLKGNTNPMKGLVEADLKFLLSMGESWEGLYIPNQQVEALQTSTGAPSTRIRQLIGSQNDPIVRHRLTLFADRLETLTTRFASHGPPDSVVLEFVREDFMGKKAKAELSKFQRDRETQRKKAREEAINAGATSGAAGLKMELLRAQGGICLYTGAALVETSLDDYVIDHIVPRAKGGPDAAMNYVLTTTRANDDKLDRTPHEWLGSSPGWDAYLARVQARHTPLRNKKVQLLTSPDAETLVRKYTALAETAWISKLAQTIVSIRFGWPGGIKNGTRKITIVSGGLTGRIRRKYRLNSLLHPDIASEEEAEKKNRDDDRHHALDAMVISFIPAWARNEKFTSFFRFPDGVNRDFFQTQIAGVVPTNICFARAALAETAYGSRTVAGSETIVQRAELVQLGMKSIAPGKTAFDAAYAAKQCRSIRDDLIRARVLEFLGTSPDESAWKSWCDTFRLTRKDGSLGQTVKLVTLNIGPTTEYKDMSKDGTGAFRKALKAHKGQIVYMDEGGTPRVRPVYAFESFSGAGAELRESGVATEIVGYFQAGCAIRLAAAVDHRKTPLAPGIYRLNTIRGDGFVVLTSATSQVSQPISLRHLIPAGFARAD